MGFPFEFAEKREQAICPLTSSCSSCPLWFNIFHSVNGYNSTGGMPGGATIDRYGFRKQGDLCAMLLMPITNRRGDGTEIFQRG